MSNRRVLIVDDVEINRQMLRKILEEDYDLLEAASGEEALEILEREHENLSGVLLDIVMPGMDGYEVLERMRADERMKQLPVIVTTGNTDAQSENKVFALGANDFITKPYNRTTIKQRLWNIINLRETSATVNALQRDRLTGLYNREFFFQKADEMLQSHPAGYYIIACFDINNFKVINDQYGSKKGDEVLKQVADIFQAGFEAESGLVGRIMADNFAVIYPAAFVDTEKLVTLREDAAALDGSIPPLSFSIGRYRADDLSLSASAMYDRAALAEESVKGRVDNNIGEFNDAMRERLLLEQDIINEMRHALENEQFEVWLQPQYNHSSGALIGAEALVRWRHPVKGLVPPDGFIPVFERNGFIYELDKYVWERACALLRAWIDEGRAPLPVSVNVSRYDLLREDLVDTVISLVERYDIPRDLLRLEITESAFSESPEMIVRVVDRLIEQGFTVEIDDFGSGYSSLNTLKDVPAQIVKLDMHFLDSSGNTDRSGNILESIVRMTKWLGMSVIAEGVETIEQADYLKSIGCNYVQGYLYAKPMPADEYDELARKAGREEKLLALETVENLDNNAFWDPKSMDTLIFNTYVGGACIFEWYKNRIEILRANEKYAKTIGGESCTVEDALNLVWEDHMDAEAARATIEAIESTIKTGDDVTYEAVYFNLFGSGKKTWLRTTFRAIARTTNRFLVYATNENLTAQREAELARNKTTEQLQAVMDNVGSGILAVVVKGGRVEYLFSNERYYKIHGYTREQYESEVKDVFDIFYPDDRERVFEAVQNANEIGKTATLEYRVVKRDKELAWMRAVITTRALEGVEGPVQMSVISDITEEKLAQEKLSELTAKIESDRETLQAMMDDTPGGFVRMRVLGDGSLVTEYANDNYCRMRGVSLEELKSAENAQIPSFIHPDDVELVSELIDETFKSGSARDTSCRLKRADGGFIPVSISGRMTRSATGQRFLNVYVGDLTESEKRELTMRETMPYVLNAIMKYSTDLVFAKDKEFRYICCSPAFVKFTRQKTEADVIGKNDYDFWTKEEADHFRGDDMRLYEKGEPLIDYIEPIPSDDGVQHYCSTSKYLLRDAAGEVIGMYGIGRDVTEERTAFERLKLLTNSIPGGLATYEASPNGTRITYFNDGFCGMFGYTREEYEQITSTGITNLAFDEDVPEIDRQLIALREDGTPINCTCRVRVKGGGVKWVDIRGDTAEQRGELYYLHVVIFDVTETKLAEQAARVHEREMQLAMSQMGKMICEYDPNTKILTVPESYAAQFGGIDAQVQNVPDSLIESGIIDPETLPAFLELYEAIARGDETGGAEYIDVRADGGRHWERVDFYSIFGADGKPVKTLIAVEDTTEQHRRYELEKSRPSMGEENLLVHALFNLTTGETLDYAYRDGSEVPIEARTAFSYGKGNLDKIIINSEERELYRELNDAKKLLERFNKGESELSIDYRRVMPDGAVIWVRNLLHMIREPGGSDVLLFEYCYNIEEEKVLALINQSLLVNNYDFITRINGTSRRYSMINNPNRTFARPMFSGDDIDAVSTQMARDYVHPDDREMTLKNTLVEGIKRNLEQTEPFRFTYRELQPDGSYRYKKLTQYYLDRERDIIIATREDVTELVERDMRTKERLEAALQAANEESRIKEREAAEQLKAIINNVNGGMSAATLIDGKIGYLFVNDEYYAMFGYTKEQFEDELPNGLTDIIHADDLQKVYENAEMSVRTGAVRFEFRAHKRDGQMIWVSSMSSACSITGVDAPVHIAVLTDISREKEVEENLRISQEQFRIAATSGGRRMARYDIKTGAYYHDDEALLATGFRSVVENVPQAFVESGNIPPECVEAYLEFYEKLRLGENCSADVAILREDGEYRWSRGDATVIFDSDGRPSQAIIVYTDITELREKEAVYKKWQQSLQLRPQEEYTLFRCNLSKNASFDSVEGSLLKLKFDEGPSSFNARTLEYVNECVYPEDAEKYRAFLNSDTLLANYYRGVRVKTLEFREKLADNALRWLRVTVELVEYPNSTDVEAYLMFEDIDKRKRDELRNKERAETDPLTGVLNRAAFAQAFEHMTSGPDAAGSLALLMLDIDGFKLINDTFGHATGDEVLIDVSRTLRGVLRQSDILGRLGGDEFLICLAEMNNDEDIEKKAGEICALLHKALSLEVFTSVSIGIAVYPRDGRDFDTLYRKMDTALYVVKDHGKNNYAFYNDSMGGDNEKRGKLKNDAAAAKLMGKKKKRRMLIVEDSPSSLALLTNMFESEFVIETAKNGGEALACLRRYGENIAVVLLDLVMPGMDGFEVLNRMRASLEFQMIPVIVVSGMDEQETSLRTIECGAADYVTKPVNADLLRLRVRSAVSRAENERLRAQNSVLLMQNTETAKYRAALKSVGAAIVEYDPSSGTFGYDASAQDVIAGSFDSRELWDILLEDSVASAEDVEKIRLLADAAAGGSPLNGGVSVALKTPSGLTHAFRVSASRRDSAQGSPARVILTFIDVDGV